MRSESRSEEVEEKIVNREWISIVISKDKKTRRRRSAVAVYAPDRLLVVDLRS